MVLSNCDTLTLNAPYFTCQPKSRCSGKVSCTHLEEPPLMSCSALAMDKVDGKDSKTWMWSCTPPISMAFISLLRAIPPTNGQSLSRSDGGISGRRSLVLKTQWKYELTYDTPPIQPSLRD